MKRRYIRVHVVKPEHPDLHTWKVTDVQSGRPVREIPIAYSAAFFASRPGGRIRASIYSDPPRIRRRRVGEPRIWTEPVLFRIVSIEAAA